MKITRKKIEKKKRAEFFRRSLLSRYTNEKEAPVAIAFGYLRFPKSKAPKIVHYQNSTAITLRLRNELLHTLKTSILMKKTT